MPETRHSKSPQCSKYHTLPHTQILVFRVCCDLIPLGHPTGGYIAVDAILALPGFKKKGLTRNDVERVVVNNSKQRFSLKTDENEQVFIRANQGHTMEVEDLELSEILHPEEAPVVVHGTYLRCLESIKKDVCAVL